MRTTPIRRPSHGRTRLPALAMAVLLAAITLAGCLGDDSADPSDAGTSDLDAQTEPEPTPEEELEAEIEKAKEQRKNVPEAHYHHYWGNPPLDEVIIFDGDVELTTDDCISSDSQVPEDKACIGPEPHIGSATFDLEDDDFDIGPEERRPEIDGQADTVFTGTGSLSAEFTWDPAEVGHALLFYYKPANSPIFFPLREDGIRITLDDPRVTIPVSAGMADPAHQFRVSRWAFMLIADGGPQEEWPGPAYIGTGNVNVHMRAINGGKESIDPPHPDPWDGRDVIDYGEVTGDFVVTQADLGAAGVDQTIYARGEEADGAEGIKLPSRAIVPTGTQKLVVTATVTPKDALSEAEQIDWGLKWHGANDEIYKIAENPEDGEDGARVYTIPIDGFLVDPPYVAESFFAFGFYPITGGQELTGNYEAEYALSFEIHKDPKFTYFF